MRSLTRGRALALGAAFVAAPAAALGAAPTRMTIAGVAEDSVTPALWAQQSGLFRRNGIDATIQAQNSGSAIAAGVAGGAYQVGKSSLTSLIVAHTRKLPFVIVAPAGLYDAANPVVGLLVRSDSPLRTASDLNGKTIAVNSLSDLYTIGIKAWVAAHGGDPSSLKLIEIPPSALTEAVLSGRVDAGSSVVPELQEAVDSGKLRVFCRQYDAIAPRFMYAAWFTTLDYARANADAVGGFVRAMRDASAYANGHHAQTVDVLAKFTTLPPALIGKMTRATYGTSLDPALIQPVIEAAAKFKLIPAPFDARELIDPALR
jgi:NitT/TauT family transport system substrate-binding protein